MKTEREAKAIQRFCDELSKTLTADGNPTELFYENDCECVSGLVNGKDVKINVYMDNIPASVRDVLRGVCKVL